ncbi:MAG: hypothetical protein EAZ97_06000 [Bacteroidetes bacterium]|nr:MAG: hypothetical protein EAZ97_06000 [Bacteroidota bacterium]
MKTFFYTILLVGFLTTKVNAQEDSLPDCEARCRLFSIKEGFEMQMNDSLGLFWANKAVKNIPKDYKFIKAFITKRILCNATSHLCLFSEGNSYRIGLETSENTIIRISIYQSANGKKKLLINNLKGNHYQKFITYHCPKTGVYYVHFQVIKAVDNIEASGGAVLSYQKK